MKRSRTYPFARLLSTLDHLTKGRIGWNIVTGYLPSAARNMGNKDQLEHDARYAHDEAIFVAGPTKEIVARQVTEIRDAREASGRGRDSARISAMLTIIVDETSAQAHAKHHEYLDYATPESPIPGAWTWPDFCRNIPTPSDGAPLRRVSVSPS